MSNIRQMIKEKEDELLKLREQLISEFSYKQIETFEDACENQGISSMNPEFQYQAANSDEEIDNSGPAFERLKVIRNALLGNKKLVWEEGIDWKYFPQFDLSRPKGSCFYVSDYHIWDGDYSALSSRLALDSSEKAIYFGSQFEDEWYEYMVEHKIK